MRLTMRLIDADALLQAIKKADEADPDLSTCWSRGSIRRVIEGLPTIEAAPVVHGRWEDKPTGRYGQQQSWCSACRKHSGIGGIEKNRHRAYCPNCGAKMDGKGECNV